MNTKKKLFIAFTVLTMVSTSGCGLLDDEDDDSDTSREVAVTTEASIETETTMITTNISSETTESKITAAEESAYASDATRTGYYEGDGFSFVADPEIWDLNDSSGYPVLTYVSDNYLECLSSINVMTVSSSYLNGMDTMEYVDDILRENYETMDGYEVTDVTEGELDGVPTYQYTVSYGYDISDSTLYMDITQIVL